MRPLTDPAPVPALAASNALSAFDAAKQGYLLFRGDAEATYTAHDPSGKTEIIVLDPDEDLDECGSLRVFGVEIINPRLLLGLSHPVNTRAVAAAFGQEGGYVR